MSSASQFFPGTIPVGGYLAMADSGSLLQLIGSTWLKSGFFQPVAGYPLAATLEHLKGHVFSVSAHTFAAGVKSVAMSGSVAVMTDTTLGSNVYRSTDGGQTWSTVAVGSGRTWSRVKFLNGKFWAMSSDTGSLVAAESTTGATGTWTTRTVVNPGTSLQPNTGDICWTGTNFVAVVQSNSVSAGLHYSPDGVSWTLAVAGGNVATQVCSIPGTGKVLRSEAAPYNQQYSSDHGVTWSGFYILSPITATSSTRPRACGSAFVYLANDGFIYRSTAPTNAAAWAPVAQMFKSVALTDTGFENAYQTSDGSRLMYMTDQGHLAITEDGLQWRNHWVNTRPAARRPFAFESAGCAMAPVSTTDSKYTASTIASAGHICSSAIFSTTQVAPGWDLYARIK